MEPREEAARGLGAGAAGFFAGAARFRRFWLVFAGIRLPAAPESIAAIESRFATSKPSAADAVAC